MSVFVYFNLHKKLWSVRSVKTGKVIAHVRHIRLKDVTFKVSEAGRQRVLREKRKNVHAGVLGTVVEDWEQIPLFIKPEPVTYNPYKYSSFVTCASQTPIETAEQAVLNLDAPHKVVAYVESAVCLVSRS